jgi:hypothetical protein
MDEKVLHNLAVKVAAQEFNNPNKSGFVELYFTEQIIDRYNKLANRANQLAFEGLIKDSLFDDLSEDLYRVSSRYNSEMNAICDTVEKAIAAVSSHELKCGCK